MPNSAKVQFIEGQNAGKSFNIVPPGAFIGRETDNDIRLSCEGASRYHAKIELADDDGSWEIRDLNSSNGTKVNGVKIAPTRKLASGDIISFGGDIMKFESSPPSDIIGATPKKIAGEANPKEHADGKLESYARARVEQEMQALIQKLKEHKSRTLRRISLLAMLLANLSIVSAFLLYKSKSQTLKYLVDALISLLQELSRRLESLQ